MGGTAVWTDRGGVGYLLKDRVNRVTDLVEALHRVAGGGTASIRGSPRRWCVASAVPASSTP